MGLLKWIKENVFNWSSEGPKYHSTMPAINPPGRRVQRRPGLRPGDLAKKSKKKKVRRS